MKTKLNILKNILLKHQRVLIAFSGGVDSSFLLFFARRVLGGENVLAVTAVSETYPKQELSLAKAFCRKYSINHKVIKTSEFANTDFVKNPVNRCFYCKDELFRKLSALAEENRMSLLDATNYSDRHDYRPGAKAIQKWGISSPLKEAKITKDEIRVFSRQFGLKTWAMPAKACLASRIPYGTALDRKVLERIEKAEDFLSRNFKLHDVRVRHHGDTARIETDRKSLARLASEVPAGKISAFFKKLGWKYTCLDLEGYRTGSLNP